MSAERTQGPFTCQVCGGEMALVTPQIRSRPHFRHRAESNCAWEPETPDHENAKLAVCDEINRLGIGHADIEVPIGGFVADVLWNAEGQYVAFEIQRANYSWAKFDEKLAGYAEQGIGVVYLFIGEQFYKKTDDGCIRLKDIEHRLMAGKSVKRFAPRWENNQASAMEYHRVIPRFSGRAVAAYLRRSASDIASLLVREPVFSPYITNAGREASSMVIETGHSVGGLNEYLTEIYRAFLAQAEKFYWNGSWFTHRIEAVWACFFRSVGLDFNYTEQTPITASHFTFEGRLRLTAWVKGRKTPAFPERNNVLVLDETPKYSQNYLFVGIASDEHTSDSAILACYTSGTSGPTVDFSQYNQSYAGMISGLHDGGIPGGNLGEGIAKRAYDLWLDADARLSRGITYPLLQPKFKNINRLPRLEAADFSNRHRLRRT